MTSNTTDWLIAASGSSPLSSRYRAEPDDVQTVNITPVLEASPWLESALIRLKSLSALPNDWDSYGSPPIVSTVLRDARKLLSSIQIQTIPEPAITPASGGGVSIEWRSGSRELEIEILPDGWIEFLRVSDNNRQSTEDFKEGRIASPDAVPINRLVTWVMSA
jgi:hypothetical protein